MATGRSYPRGWQERSGQVNHKYDNSYDQSESTQHRTSERKHPRGSRFITQPDSFIVGTKKRGFGSLGTKESNLLPKVSADSILGILTHKTHYRYKVNVYCKKVPR